MNCPICNKELTYDKNPFHKEVFDLDCFPHYSIRVNSRFAKAYYLCHYFYFNNEFIYYKTNNGVTIHSNQFPNVMTVGSFEEYISYCKRLNNLKAFL